MFPVHRLSVPLVQLWLVRRLLLPPTHISNRRRFCIRSMWRLLVSLRVTGGVWTGLESGCSNTYHDDRALSNEPPGEVQPRAGSLFASSYPAPSHEIRSRLHLPETPRHTRLNPGPQILCTSRRIHPRPSLLPTRPPKLAPNPPHITTHTPQGPLSYPHDCPSSSTAILPVPETLRQVKKSSIVASDSGDLTCTGADVECGSDDLETFRKKAGHSGLSLRAAVTAAGVRPRGSSAHRENAGLHMPIPRVIDAPISVAGVDTPSLRVPKKTQGGWMRRVFGFPADRDKGAEQIPAGLACIVRGLGHTEMREDGEARRGGAAGGWCYRIYRANHANLACRRRG
ncbi:hypothetical protein FPV67DRAFT_1449651 [Lyophyllum atratum]|nr:hypothetical protein FPV67DRAFT_1449651 [Lyophyllum atratum]